MNDFRFRCPHCQQSLEAPEEMLGTVTDCPSCNSRIQLPAPQPHPKEPPLPALQPQRQIALNRTKVLNEKLPTEQPIAKRRIQGSVASPSSAANTEEPNEERTFGLLSRKTSFWEMVAIGLFLLAAGGLVCGVSFLFDQDPEMRTAGPWLILGGVAMGVGGIFANRMRPAGYSVFSGVLWDADKRTWTKGVYGVTVMQGTDAIGLSPRHEIVRSVVPHGTSRPCVVPRAQPQLCISLNAMNESDYKVTYFLNGITSTEFKTMSDLHLLHHGQLQNVQPIGEDHIVETLADFGTCLQSLSKDGMPEIPVTLAVSAPTGHAGGTTNKAALAGILTGGMAGAVVTLALSNDPRYKRMRELIHGAEGQPGNTGLKSVAERFGWKLQIPEVN